MYKNREKYIKGFKIIKKKKILDKIIEPFN